MLLPFRESVTYRCCPLNGGPTSLGCGFFVCEGVKKVAAIAEMGYLTDNYLAAQSALRDNYHTDRSVSRSVD